MIDASDRQLRILLAIGDPEQERQLMASLGSASCTVVGRCLDAPTLVQQAQDGRCDGVLVSQGLHRLTEDTLVTLRMAGVPVVLLGRRDDGNGAGGLAYVVPPNSPEVVILAALNEAVRRGVAADVVGRRGANDGRLATDGGGGEAIALVSGKGAPGVSTISIALAAALSAGGRKVVLVDGDLRGGTVGPYLDLDPRLGLAGVSAGSAELQGAALSQLQPGPGFSVLAGIERPEAAERLVPERAVAAIGTLVEEFDLTLIDCGECLSGVTPATGVAFVRAAGRVVLVTTADLLGIWHARACLRFLTESLGVPPDAVSAVVNRHRADDRYGSYEVERALGIRVLALVPEDRQAARRARDEQVPITGIGGKAARVLTGLAASWTAQSPDEGTSAAAQAPMWRRWRRQPAEGRH